MKKRLIGCLSAGLIMVTGMAAGADHPQLKAFPHAEAGMSRFVIALPHKERGDEDTFKVEIIVGREMLTDGVNLMRLANTIEPRVVQGWGYTYYQVAGPAIATSTMMAPAEGQSGVTRFVAAAPLLIRYNSRLPVVVYAPEGYQVRYRIWRATESAQPAEEH